MLRQKRSIVLFVISIENLKNPKIIYLFEKTLFAVSVRMKMKKYLKILKILDLTTNI